VTNVTRPGAFEIYYNSSGFGMDTRPLVRGDLHAGDIIVSFEGNTVKRISQLDSLLTLFQPGYYDVTVLRHNDSESSSKGERLHLKLRKVFEFKPGSEWGAPASDSVYICFARSFYA